MITMFRIMAGKDDPNLWFSVSTPRDGAASTRQKVILSQGENPKLKF